MITRDALIKIGRYNKPHGVNGEISATLDVDTEVLTHFSCLVSDIDGIFVPFFVTGSRDKSAQVTLLSIDGVTSDEQASMLVNKDIFVLRREYEKDFESCFRLCLKEETLHLINKRQPIFIETLSAYEYYLKK